jgi:hypothetical protein
LITRYVDDLIVNQLENLKRFGEHLVRFGWELCTGGVFLYPGAAAAAVALTIRNRIWSFRTWRGLSHY